MMCHETDHSLFYKQSTSSCCIYLIVYVDDIVITCDNCEGIKGLKQHLFLHFQTEDLGRLQYFLGIQVAQSRSGVAIT